MTSKQDIIELENKFWQTMIDRDVDTALYLRRFELNGGDVFQDNHGLFLHGA